MKIPHLFVLDEKGRATAQVNPECEWVKTVRPIVTRLRDGVALLAENGRYYLFGEIKQGQKVHGAKPIPPYRTKGAQPAWLPLRKKNEFDVMLMDKLIGNHRLDNGTYEIFGPGIKDNPEAVSEVTFLKHGTERINGIDATFSMMRIYMHRMPVKGFVLEHPHRPGLLAKVLRSDFGEPWPLAHRTAAVGV